MDRLSRAAELVKTSWKLQLLLILALNCFALFKTFDHEDMWGGIENHDTRVMTRRITEYHNPAKWLFGDWPLLNGFYRPLPSESFEVDWALFGKNLNAFKIQTWIIPTLAAFALLWFIFELTRRQAFAFGCTALFAFWQSGLVDHLPIELACYILAGAAFFASLLAEKSVRMRLLIAMCILISLAWELGISAAVDLSGQTFSYRAMIWPPGRTATICAVFMFLALGSYCRFEREREFKWAFFTFVNLLLCFMSYEQCVTIAPIIVCAAIYLRLNEVKTTWLIPVAVWVLTGMYALLHLRYIPTDTKYLKERARPASSGIIALMKWLAPTYDDLSHLFTFDSLIALIIPSVYGCLISIASTVVSWISLRRQWTIAAFGLIASVCAYAPMAFQLPLIHYNYIPYAFRTMFTATLLLECWRCCAGINRSSFRIQGRTLRQG